MATGAAGQVLADGHEQLHQAAKVWLAGLDPSAPAELAAAQRVVVDRGRPG